MNLKRETLLMLGKEARLKRAETTVVVIRRGDVCMETAESGDVG